MKKLVLSICMCVAALSSFTAFEAKADGWDNNDAVLVDPSTGEQYVVVDSINFPGPFRGWVSTKSGAKTVDGELRLYKSDALKVTYIQYTYRNVVHFVGLEYFPELEELDMHACKISKSLPSMPKLKRLNLSDNRFAAFSAELPELEELSISSNYLTTLDVSSLPKLKTLNCAYNKLTTLDVSDNAELENLYCYNNSLTSIDVTNNPLLSNLYVAFNPLAEAIDLSNNRELTVIMATSCNQQSFDFTNNEKLITIGIALNSIDVDNMEALISSLPVYNGPVSLTEGLGMILVIDYNMYVSTCYEYEGVSTENNHMTDLQVAAAKAKNWEVIYTKPDSNEFLSYPGDPTKGDSNEDGIVNTGDVSELYNIVLGNNRVYERNGDINGDGVINTGDVSGVYGILLDGE